MSDLDFSEKAALQRQRGRVAEGIPLVLEDSDYIGNKYTHASWGMCSRETEKEFDSREKDAPNTPMVLANYRCPMRKTEVERGRWGCFYSCRLFKGPRPSRDEAIKLYDDLILSLYV